MFYSSSAPITTGPSVAPSPAPSRPLVDDVVSLVRYCAEGPVGSSGAQERFSPCLGSFGYAIFSSFQSNGVVGS